MSEAAIAPVTVESALRSILRISQDRTLTEKRLRTQVWGFAKAALAQLEAGQVKCPSPGSAPVAWLHVWAGYPRKVETTLADDKYGLSEAIPLHTDEWGEIIAWRWADGGGRNADYRYSFVNPLEDPEEVERQGAESVIGCAPLYVHPLAKGYKA